MELSFLFLAAMRKSVTQRLRKNLVPRALQSNSSPLSLRKRRKKRQKMFLQLKVPLVLLLLSELLCRKIKEELLTLLVLRIFSSVNLMLIIRM